MANRATYAGPVSATESEIQPSGGFCFLHGEIVDGDLADHFSQHHQRVSRKARTSIKSWQDRLDGVVSAIDEIRQESDIDAQIQNLDQNVIKELYLVRMQIQQSGGKSLQKGKRG